MGGGFQLMFSASTPFAYSHLGEHWPTRALISTYWSAAAAALMVLSSALKSNLPGAGDELAQVSPAQ